jgi:hypothetical protein
MTDRIGPTHAFPEGRFRQDDDGQLAIGVAVDRRKVVLVFGAPVTWVAFGPAQARELARSLNEKADMAERQADA